jgi:hypothetical protein
MMAFPLVLPGSCSFLTSHFGSHCMSTLTKLCQILLEFKDLAASVFKRKRESIIFSSLYKIRKQIKRYLIRMTQYW